jgi:hypothetical protein
MVALILLAISCTNPTDPAPKVVTIHYTINWSGFNPACNEVDFNGTISNNGGSSYYPLFKAYRGMISGSYTLTVSEIETHGFQYIWWYNGGYGKSGFTKISYYDTYVVAQ